MFPFGTQASVLIKQGAETCCAACHAPGPTGAGLRAGGMAVDVPFDVDLHQLSQPKEPPILSPSQSQTLTPPNLSVIPSCRAGQKAGPSISGRVASADASCQNVEHVCILVVSY